MNNNQKIIVVIVIIVVSGLCYAFYEKGKNDEKKATKEKKDRKNEEEIKKNSKRIDEIEKEVNNAFKENPNADANSTIEHLAQERKDLFQDLKIRIVEGKPKTGAEDTLKALQEKEDFPTPEAVSDLIDEPVESVILNEYELENEGEPSQDSDEIASPKETATKELATEEEVKRKIKSKRGEDKLYNDIMKLTLENADGVPRLPQHEAEEFYQNISGYNNYKPTGKILTPKFATKENLLGYIYQICKKHKLPSDNGEKFAAILTDNFSQFLGQNPASITTYWARTMKNRKPEDVINDPHSIYVEP